jgi:hypothetical protein
MFASVAEGFHNYLSRTRHDARVTPVSHRVFRRLLNLPFLLMCVACGIAVLIAVAPFGAGPAPPNVEEHVFGGGLDASGWLFPYAETLRAELRDAFRELDRLCTPETERWRQLEPARSPVVVRQPLRQPAAAGCGSASPSGQPARST